MLLLHLVALAVSAVLPARFANLATQARASARAARLQSGSREQYIPAGFHDYGTVMFETTVDMMSPECAQVMGMANDDEYAAIITDKQTANAGLLSHKPVFVDRKTQGLRQMVRKVASDGEVEIYKWQAIDFNKVFKTIEMGTFVRQPVGAPRPANASLKGAEVGCSLKAKDGITGSCWTSVSYSWDEESKRPQKLVIAGESYAQLGFTANTEVSLTAKIGGGGFSMKASADLFAAAGIGLHLEGSGSQEKMELGEPVKIPIPMPMETVFEFCGLKLGFEIFVVGETELRDISLTIPQMFHYYRGFEYSYGVTAEFSKSLEGYHKITSNGPNLVSLQENSDASLDEVLENMKIRVTPVIRMKLQPTLYIGEEEFGPYIGAELGAVMGYTGDATKCRFPYLKGQSEVFVNLVWNVDTGALLRCVLRGILGRYYDLIAGIVKWIMESVKKFLENLAESRFIVRKLLGNFAENANKADAARAGSIELWRSSPIEGCLFTEKGKEGLAELKESKYVPAVLIVPVSIEPMVSDLSKRRTWDVMMEWNNKPRHRAFTWSTGETQPEIVIFQTNVERESAWRYQATEIRDWAPDWGFCIPTDGSYREVTNTANNSQVIYGWHGDDTALAIKTKQYFGVAVATGKEFDISVGPQETADMVVRISFERIYCNIADEYGKHLVYASIYKCRIDSEDCTFIGKFDSGGLKCETEYTQDNWKGVIGKKWHLDCDLGKNPDYYIKIDATLLLETQPKLSVSKTFIYNKRDWTDSSGRTLAMSKTLDDAGWVGSPTQLDFKLHAQYVPDYKLERTTDKMFCTLDARDADSEYMLIHSGEHGYEVIQDDRVVGIDSSMTMKKEMAMGTGGYKKGHSLRLSLKKMYANVAGWLTDIICNVQVMREEDGERVQIGAFTTDQIPWNTWLNAATAHVQDWYVDFNIGFSRPYTSKLVIRAQVTTDGGEWERLNKEWVFDPNDEQWENGYNLKMSHSDDGKFQEGATADQIWMEFTLEPVEATAAMLIDHTLANSKGIIAKVYAPGEYDDNNVYGILRSYHKMLYEYWGNHAVAVLVNMKGAVPLSRYDTVGADKYVVYATLSQLAMYDNMRVGPNGDLSDHTYSWYYIPFRRTSASGKLTMSIESVFYYGGDSALCSVGSSEVIAPASFGQTDYIYGGCAYETGINWQGYSNSRGPLGGDIMCYTYDNHIVCRSGADYIARTAYFFEAGLKADQVITTIPTDVVRNIPITSDQTLEIVKAASSPEEEWGQLYLSNGQTVSRSTSEDDIVYKVNVKSESGAPTYAVGLCLSREKKNCVVVDETVKSESADSFWLVDFQSGIIDYETWFTGKRLLSDNVRFQIVKGGRVYHYLKDWVGEVTYTKLTPGKLKIIYNSHTEGSTVVVDVSATLSGVAIPFSVKLGEANQESLFALMGYDKHSSASSFLLSESEDLSSNFCAYTSEGTVVVTENHFNYNIDKDSIAELLDVSSEYIQTFQVECPAGSQKCTAITPGGGEESGGEESSSSGGSGGEESSSSGGSGGEGSGGHGGNDSGQGGSKSLVGPIVGAVAGVVVLGAVVAFVILYKMKKLPCGEDRDADSCSAVSMGP